MLVKNLKYGSKVESAPCRSTRVNIAPQNGTGPYNLNDQIIVNIPTRNNLVLVPTESYLKFTATVTSGAANNIVRWDSCGAHGLIQRLRVWSGSNLLEDIDCYGLLAKELFDLQVSSDSTYGKHNILVGTRNDLIVTLPDITAGAAYTQADMTALDQAKLSCLQVNSGESLGTLANAGTYSATYCLNLVSILGTLCSQNYFPLFSAVSAPIRLEIQLASSAVNALNASGAITSITLTNVEYVANFIELSDNAMGMIYSSLQGAPLQFVIPSYRNYQYSYQLSTAQTQVSMPIPSKFSSLKSIIISIRDKFGIATFFPFSSCTKQLTDYSFRVGSTIMPTKSPNTYQEMFSEVLKAVGSMSDLNHQPSIEKTSYTLQDSVANDAPGSVNSGSFYLGLDLESYSNADKSSVFAGYNSNTDDIFCIMNFAGQASATTVRFDAFAMFDQVVVFENNTAYVKF